MRRSAALGIEVQALGLVEMEQIATAPRAEWRIVARDPDQRHARIARDHYSSRADAVLWQILLVPPHARTCKERTGAHRILGALTVRWRLARDPIDRAHGTDDEGFVSAERLPAEPAQTRAHSTAKGAGVGGAEIRLAIAPSDEPWHREACRRDREVPHAPGSLNRADRSVEFGHDDALRSAMALRASSISSPT